MTFLEWLERTTELVNDSIYLRTKKRNHAAAEETEKQLDILLQTPPKND